jgi:hypothetical protein
VCVCGGGVDNGLNLVCGALLGRTLRHAWTRGGQLATVDSSSTDPHPLDVENASLAGDPVHSHGTSGATAAPAQKRRGQAGCAVSQECEGLTQQEPLVLELSTLQCTPHITAVSVTMYPPNAGQVRTHHVYTHAAKQR